jgi:tRNA A37 threonylcarbamoyladenosine synthetase subunit TsaC/SUA5/YrdC
LDSGPASDQAIPSTVIKINGHHLEGLREGTLPFSSLETVFNEGRVS